METIILQQRLVEGGQINQANEIRLQSLIAQSEELEKLRETINNYQQAFAKQQEKLEIKQREHAIAAQSLSHEFKCHAVTEMALEQESSRVRDLIGFLNGIDLPRRVDTNDDTSLGLFWVERDAMKLTIEQQNMKIKGLEEELQSARSDQQHKQLLLEELSGVLRVDPESIARPPSSSSIEEGEIKPDVQLLPERSKQRKRARC